MKTQWVCLPLLALASCTAEGPAPAAVADSSPSAVEARAGAAARDFSARLQTALKTQLESEGAVAAIAFCKHEAAKIAAQTGKAHGVALGRIPVPGKVRNPANALATWQAEGLTQLIRQQRQGMPVAELRWQQTQGLPEGIALRMMRGIEVQPACLSCHGQTLAEPVRTALAKHYPNDTATGFSAGDLRGALWVEVPASMN